MKQLQAFVWVADLGSFRKAAERLNTTQPNISSRIAALESVLDLSLMERDAGSVRLTSKGLLLLEYARNVLRSTDLLIEASNQEGLYDTVLKLGVTEMVVHTWLRDYLKILKDRYPNISVELTVDLATNLEKELFDRSIDLAFQNGPFALKSTGSKDLGVYPLIWIASPGLGLQDLEQVGIEDLAQYPILTHARGTQPYAEVATHFSKRRDLSARLVPSSNLAACIHMTVDGFGTATVPAAMVVEELRSGELVQIRYDWRPRSLRFSARFGADKSTRLVARAADIAGEVSQAFIHELAHSSTAMHDARDNAS